MKAAAMKSLLAAVLAVGTVAAVAVAADVSEEKKREISAAEAADIEEEKKAKAAAEAAKKEKAGKPEISAAEAADRAEEEKAKAEAEAAAADGGGAEAGTLAAAVKAPKGTLKNPYTDNKEAIAEGRQLYLDYSCNGCHGGGGGGGMCPPLTNERFVYGSDDDTIFRLIAVGSDVLLKDGYKRIAKETVVGPMPPYLEIIETDEELWKIIAFVRSVYRGRAKKRDW